MEYVPYRSCWSYLERDCKVFRGVSIAGSPRCAGQFCFVRPFCTERYVSDVEPLVRTDLPLRPILWYRMHESEIPSNWRRSPKDVRFRKTGYSALAPSYEKSWTPHALRHLRAWQRQSAWEIYTPIPQEFIAGYKKVKRPWHLTYFFTDLLKKKIAAHGNRVRLFGIRQTGRLGPIRAGLAVIDIPEAKQSVHFMSFILSGPKEEGGGVGIIDHWFQTSLDLGWEYADFDLFWAPGDRNDWKGFSQFKSQFGVHYVEYPVSLVRWAGTLWRNFKKRI